MKISMLVDFQILQKINGEYIPISKKKVDSLSIGGYYFIINGKAVPFDWDAFEGDEENNIFSFETGYGFMFNDFELSDCYDEDYEALGISRENITARFLASAERIDEFHINFINENGDEVDLGNNNDEDYRIKILEIVFVDIETEKEYKVEQKVLDDYNKGILKEIF